MRESNRVRPAFWKAHAGLPEGHGRVGADMVRPGSCLGGSGDLDKDKEA